MYGKDSYTPIYVEPHGKLLVLGSLKKAGIDKCLKPIADLHVRCPSEMKIGERTTEANTAVQNVLEKLQQTLKRKRKAYTSFGDEQRIKIRCYVEEYRTAATLKKFKSDVPNLRESTVRLFKRKYHDALKKKVLLTRR